MKKKILLFGAIFSMMVGLNSCSSDNDPVDNTDENQGETPVDPVDPQALDLTKYLNGTGVMMQAFYWDVEPRHDWYNLLSGKVEGWADAGVNRIWLPAPSKGASGGYSMGYDPSDYFDLGEFFQHGTIPTRFGTRAELEALITKAHSVDLEVIADIVINHNSGGGREWNPYRNDYSYTRFDPENGNASGKFNRNFENFYPNSTSPVDPGSLFYPEQNLDHNQEYVQNWLWKADNSVAKYYMNEIGFDGWRFDYVQGFEPWVIKAWMDEVGGFAVGENWDGNPNNLRAWVAKAGIPAFDFSAFYKMEEAFDRHNDLTYLGRDMLRKTHPEMAVTFVANHDSEKDSNQDNRIEQSNKMKAYAYILTHDGYPTIFYLDYENANFQDELKNLILINNSIATGDVEILYNDDDEYIMKRSGSTNNPGLILYINTSSNTKRRTVNTSWINTTLIDYSENSTLTPTTSSTGSASIEAPAGSYSIWSITE